VQLHVSTLIGEMAQIQDCVKEEAMNNISIFAFIGMHRAECASSGSLKSAINKQRISEHALPKLVGWVRFLVESCRKLEK